MRSNAIDSHAASYDGSKYRARRYYVCDCGFAVPTGKMDEHGRYPGSEPMLKHLVQEHGYVLIGQRPA